MLLCFLVLLQPLYVDSQENLFGNLMGRFFLFAIQGVGGLFGQGRQQGNGGRGLLGVAQNVVRE